MTLHFPNPSRSFDASRNRVRFWGYDQSIEVTFFLEEGALRKLDPALQGGAEADYLNAFDAALVRIRTVAEAVYRRNRGQAHSLSLAAADF